MEGFWKWLTAANARGVFFGALIGLVGVLGYWIWNEVAANQTVPGAAPAKSKFEVQTKSDMIDFLVNNAFTSRYESVENPFLPVPLKKKTTPPPAVDIPVVSQVVAPPPPSLKIYKPEVKKIKLVYRGRIVQSQDQVLALIEDQSKNQTKGYKANTNLYGLRVGDIGLKDMALISGKGATNLLQLGRVAEIMEQNDAE